MLTERPKGLERIVETALHLLMRDGALHVTFQPRLTSNQSTQLMRAADAATTKDELTAALVQLARAWGNELLIDGNFVVRALAFA